MTPRPGSRAVELDARAKLNLYLHVLGRRPDGYHELQTLFQFLDHGDELGFRCREDGQIRLHTDIPGVPHDSNLIVRAARRLQEQSGTRLGADIWLDKRLPMGGGIGGGSSDAATTLVGLNHLWGLDWSEVPRSLLKAMMSPKGCGAGWLKSTRSGELACARNDSVRFLGTEGSALSRDGSISKV